MAHPPTPPLPRHLADIAARNRLEAVKRAARQQPVTDAITWIEENFYIPETRQPIQLMDYQKAVIREALSKDDNGLFKYSMVLYSDLKKSAKSVIAGAVALYLAWFNPYETVRIVGNDLKQADSRTFTYIKNAIELNPKLKPQCKVVQYRIDLPNNTIIQAVAVDPKGEAGGGDLITCFTELWAYKNEASKKMWVEMALSPLKFGKSIRWGETYAGYDGESPVLEQLYTDAVVNGTSVDVGIEGLELTRNKRTLALWNTRPRCYWQTPEYYAHEQTQYPPNEYSRIHENKWARSTDAFVPMGWWDGCEITFPSFIDNASMVIALDAGVTSDLFAMVGVSRIDGVTMPRYVNTWSPEANGKIDFEKPFAELERLASIYNIICVVYDPYQLHYFASLLAEKHIVNTQEFLQGVKRLEADKALYDAIRERKIGHDGNPLLREHIENANREAANDNKLRIVKRAAHKKIDAAVALSMANHTAVELDLGNHQMTVSDAPDIFYTYRG